MSTAYDGIPSNLSGTLPAAAPISSSTNASPIVVTTTNPHGLVTGDLVQINGHLVNTAANGLWTIAVSSPTVFSLIGSTGNGVGSTTGNAYNMGFGTSFQIPSDGDAAIAASVNVGLEANGDRTSLLAANIGSYADLGIVSGPVTPATPWSTSPWGTHTYSANNTWELVTTTPSPVFTKADFFNAGDVLDVSLSLTALTHLTTATPTYLSIWYAFRASSAASPGTPAILPGSGMGVGDAVNTIDWIDNATLNGQIVVPSLMTTIDLYVYTLAENASAATINLIGPYNPTIRIRRPTGFRSTWP